MVPEIAGPVTMGVVRRRRKTGSAQARYRHLGQYAILAVLLATLLGSVAGAQESGSGGEASVAPKAPEAIPAAQIPARASSARVTLDSIRSRLGRVAVTDEVDLEQMAQAIDELRQKADPSRLERRPEFRIAELQRQVLFYQRELAHLEARDIAWASRLSTDAAELARLRGLWSATLVQAERDQLSRPLIDEVKVVLSQIEATEGALEPSLERALAARKRASQYETRMETLLRSLQDASDVARSRRWTRDVPPIWSRDALRTSAARDWALLKDRVADQLRFAEHFFESRRRALELLAVMALVGLAGVAYLRRKSDWFRTADETLADASKVLSRPFSSLLLVYLATALISSAYAPPVVVSALAVATMLVLLRLMPGRLVGGYNILLVGLAVLFLLDRLRAVVPFESLAFRLDQLLTAIGLGAGYFLVLRLKRRGGLPPKSWLSLLARIAPVALFLLVIAVAANLNGNISLADLLVHGTLASTWVSAVLFAAAFIVDDFTQMLVRSKVGQKLRMVTLRGPEIAQASRRLTRFLALFSWAAITLSSFQLLQPVVTRLRDWLAISWRFGELEFTLGGVATFVIGVLIAVYASRLVRFLLNEEILSRVAWPPGAKSTTATLAYYGVLFAGLLLALSAAGIETSQFAIIVGALGVGIGFGLQNVVNNFVSGLILMFERPIQPGDIIDVDTLQGRVIEIGLRATRVQTWEGAEVIVPNGTMLSGNLVNWTLSDSSRRVEIPVGVAYGTSVRRVLDLLTRIAQEQPNAMKDPPPVVLFSGFGESSLDFSVRFWTRDAATAVAARSEAGVAISEALEAEGIEIPFPQRDLHLRSVDAGFAAAVAPAAGGDPPVEAPATAGRQDTGNVDSLGPPAQESEDTDGPAR